MYQSTPGGRGAGLPAAAIVPTAAGVAVLPNTGNNHLLMIVSIVSIVTGSAILLSTVARYIVKKTYQA